MQAGLVFGVPNAATQQTSRGGSAPIVFRLIHFLMSINKYLFTLLVLGAIPFASVHAQDIDQYLNEIRQGETARARADLPKLMQQYPKDPGVRYLQGVLQTDGEIAYDIFKDIADKSDPNPYKDDATLKVGEYLYARGLYISATRYLRRIPQRFPESPHLQHASNLLINSLAAAGKTDSARIVLRNLESEYPSLALSDPTAKETTQTEQEAEIEATTAPEPVDLTEKNPYVEPEGDKDDASIEERTGDYYTLQVGAFSTLDNAVKQKEHFESNEITQEEVRKRTRGSVELYLVWVGQYESHDAADQAGASLKSRLDFPYFVVHVDE